MTEKSMSPEDELVTRFIDEANRMNENDHHRPRVSAALLFAAARYNAFTWLHRDATANPDQTPEEAEEFFVGHYRTMFRENVSFLKARAD